MSDSRDIDIRNIAAHHYGSFDIETLWDTIKNDIPVCAITAAKY